MGNMENKKEGAIESIAIREVQEKVSEFTHERAWDIILPSQRGAHLVREVGKLSEYLLYSEGVTTKAPDMQKMPKQLGDVLFSLCALANLLEIDLGQQFSVALETDAIKYPAKETREAALQAYKERTKAYIVRKEPRIEYKKEEPIESIAIREVQEKVSEFTHERAWDIILPSQRGAHLAREVGKLSEYLLYSEGVTTKAPDMQKMPKQLGDVLFSLCALANLLEIDLGQQFSVALETDAIKYPAKETREAALQAYKERTKAPILSKMAPK